MLHSLLTASRGKENAVDESIRPRTQAEQEQEEAARAAADLANNRDKVERADVKAARDDAMMRHLLREVA